MRTINFINKNAYVLSSVITISVFLFLYKYPINLGGTLVSPSQYAWIDIDLYIRTAHNLFHDFNKIIESFVNFYSGKEESASLYAGILLPVLIELTQYSRENLMPLSLMFLLTGVIVNILWIFWIKNNNKGRVAFFLLFPYFYFYSTIISTEIIYALIITILFIVTDTGKTFYSGRIFFLLVLLTLIRPSSIILIILYLYLELSNHNKINIRGSAYLFALLIFGSLYYYPYFIDFSNTAEIVFFNMDAQGLMLYLFKFLYVFGIRPPGSGGELIFFLRTIVGIISIFGLFVLFKKQNKFHICFVLFQLVSLLYGHATERYAIFIYPLLWYYAQLPFRGLTLSSTKRMCN